jgi:hypothetical protein
LSAIRLSDDDSVGTVVRLGRATAPEDGTALNDLIRVAENRPLPPPPITRQSIH